MARGSELETAAQQTRDHAARDGRRNCEGALRAGRRIARRHQTIESERANGKITGPPDNGLLATGLRFATRRLVVHARLRSFPHLPSAYFPPFHYSITSHCPVVL